MSPEKDAERQELQRLLNQRLQQRHQASSYVAPHLDELQIKFKEEVEKRIHEREREFKERYSTHIAKMEFKSQNVNSEKSLETQRMLCQREAQHRFNKNQELKKEREESLKSAFAERYNQNLHVKEDDKEKELNFREMYDQAILRKSVLNSLSSSSQTIN